MVQVAGGDVGQVLGGVDELGGQVEGQRHRRAVVLRSQLPPPSVAGPVSAAAAARPARHDQPHAQFAITMEIYTVVSSAATRDALERLG